MIPIPILILGIGGTLNVTDTVQNVQTVQYSDSQCT